MATILDRGLYFNAEIIPDPVFVLEFVGSSLNSQMEIRKELHLFNIRFTDYRFSMTSRSININRLQSLLVELYSSLCFSTKHFTLM